VRVLVTGASGLLGGRLASLLATAFEVTAGRHRAPTPPGLAAVPLDLLAPGSLAAAIERARPDGIVHAAALADPDRCERSPAEAEALNAAAAHDLAVRCRRLGMRLINLSTDLVYDGSGSMHGEDRPAEPILVYGRTKLRGEEAVLAEAPGSVVLRVALVHGRGFGPRPTASEAIAGALEEGRDAFLYTDQFRTPVDPESVTAAIAAALRGAGEGRYHLGGPERLSRHAFGLRVAAARGLSAGRIHAVTHSERPQAPRRPADVSLDSTRARHELGFRPRALEEAAREGRAAADIIRAEPWS
jgi:dTDP-4-dehydrorhamnose reductase